MQAGRQLFLVHPFAAQRARDVVAPRHLGDDRAQPAAGGDQPEGRGHGRLPDAALAGDDDEVARQQGDGQSSPSQ